MTKKESEPRIQFILNKDLEGLRVRMPSGTRNFWVDGAKVGVKFFYKIYFFLQKWLFSFFLENGDR